MEARPSDFPAFRYERLPSAASIRLLRRVKHESQDNGYDCLAFEVQTFDLDRKDELPAFEALSYTWGDPLPAEFAAQRVEFDSNRHWALLNGGVTRLMPNLHEGLLALTKQRFINETTTMWSERYPLHEAAENGDVSEVRALLRAGADVSLAPRLVTAVGLAYEKGHLEVVEELTRPEYLAGYLKVIFDRRYSRPGNVAVERHLQKLIGHRPEYDGWWWVDAICINQEDLDERASQVQLMSRIYSTARRVPVWLGRLEDNSRTYNHAVEYYGHSHFSDSIKTEDLIVISNLFKRNWFSRAWVIQEVVLARSVTFHLGTFMFKYEDVDQLLQNLEKTKNCIPGNSPDEIREGMRAIQQGQNIRKMRNHFQRPEKGEFPLYAALAQGSSYECTEPRDRIYSLLSLVRNPDGEAEAPVAVSYTAPLHELFAAATRQALMESQSLALLSWASAWFDDGDPVAAALPSWVPAYHLFRAVRGPESSLEGLPQVFGAEAPGSPAQRPCFAASSRLRRAKNEQAFEGITDSYSPELEINGLSVDTITHVGEVNSGRKLRFKSSWLNLAARLGTKYVDGDSVAKALMVTAFAGKFNARSVFKATTGAATWEKAKQVWRDLICNSLSVDPATTKAAGKEILTRGQMQKLDDLDAADGSQGFLVSSRDLAASSGGESGSSGGSGNGRSIDNLLRDLAIDDDLRPLAECLYSALDRRVMFVTEKGCLGLGPAGTQVGDEIWILPAASVPFILRRRDDGEYRHIGETYVHGIMFGEAVPDPKVRLKNIVLV